MKLIILDRDGVINQDSDAYIKNPEEWQPIEGSLQAIARFNRAGYHVYVATNQSGLARGLFTIETLNAIHRKMLEAVKAVGGQIDAILFCPHGPDDHCNCRKPKTGLYEEISTRCHTNLESIPVVGDSLRDLQAAIKVKATPILVRTGKGEKTLTALNKDHPEISVYDNLQHMAEQLLKENESS
ncbi:MAG: D-glycero-beta-D-manno-heptose 1,7-bisphosphate 7-phosphatase [Candidatus Thiodiazotropha sp.]